jgi:hypothetical protein
VQDVLAKAQSDLADTSQQLVARQMECQELKARLQVRAKPFVSIAKRVIRRCVCKQTPAECKKCAMSDSSW